MALAGDASVIIPMPIGWWGATTLWGSAERRGEEGAEAAEAERPTAEQLR